MPNGYINNSYFKSGEWEAIDLAWLAGILDGEGYIGITKTPKKSCKRGFTYQVRIQVATKDPIIAVECYKIMGIGRVYNQKNGCTLWIVDAKHTKTVLQAVIPFLRLKKNQAQICIDYVNTITDTGGYLSEEEWASRDNLYSLCRQMKADNYAERICK